MSKSSLVACSALAVCLAAWLVSCNKNSNPTSPGGGSGGGPAELNGSLTANGGTYSHTFSTAGTFNYHCTIHPGCLSLAGTIVVVAAGSPIQNRLLAIAQTGGSSGIYTQTCSSLSVSRDTVRVGDQVTWTNSSPFPHTVMSQ